MSEFFKAATKCDRAAAKKAPFYMDLQMIEEGTEIKCVCGARN